MEATILIGVISGYNIGGYIGTMEKKMETTRLHSGKFRGYIWVIQG